MKFRSVGVALVTIVMTQPIFAQGADPVAQHAAAGRRAAGTDFGGLAGLCDVASSTAAARPTGTTGGGRQRRPRPATGEAPMVPTPLAPRKVFDNLYFVGTAAVSAWVVKTSAGLILIDALNNEAEAKIYIDGGLRKLGLNPAAIKYLVITHAHGDHYGGSKYIIDRYHPKVVMTADDWAVLEDPAQRLDVPDWGPPPKRDVATKPVDVLTLGDTRLDLIETPGHTPGTMSLLFPVRDRGTMHRAVLWGGTGFNFGPLPDRYRMYARSAEAMRTRVLNEKVSVFLSNHAKRDNTVERFKAIDAAPGGPSPYVMSPPRIANAFVALRECATANLLALPPGE